MKVDICKLYYDFWDNSPIAKHNEPKDILVSWSGLELQQFVEYALKQVNDVQASEATAILPLVSKRYFLFGCVNADKQKLNKLIIADDKESAIANLETSYPYIERWYTIEELNVC